MPGDLPLGDLARRFVASTETALTELLAADLSGLDLVAIMIDGVHFGGQLFVAAMGIDANGVKPRSPWRRATQEHPGTAASLREGLAETLTVARLGVPPTLARTLRSTNAVESTIEICRDHSRNV
jgi:hypothetical protein